MGCGLLTPRPTRVATWRTWPPGSPRAKADSSHGTDIRTQDRAHTRGRLQPDRHGAPRLRHASRHREKRKPTKGQVMRLVVIGGTGLIGSKVVEKLKAKGYDAIAASPNTGVNTITGEGLAEALAGADVVVDVANSPSFEDQAAMDFFQTAGKNLTAAEVAA